MSYPRRLSVCFLALAVTLACGVVRGEDLVADSVLVVKSERRLYLLDHGERVASFPVTFGGDPQGHKQTDGDGRTPEGHYVLDWKNEHSAYYRAFHVSYPNQEDRAIAARQSLDPGGEIMVHGQKNGYGWLSPLSRFFNWTDGCIALSDADMDTLWATLDPGTPIEIRP